MFILYGFFPHPTPFPGSGELCSILIFQILNLNLLAQAIPGNNSQLSCTLAHKLETFCGKNVIYAEKMQNIRRKWADINSFYRNSSKFIKKLNGSQNFQNILYKPWDIFQIISASLDNFLQLGCTIISMPVEPPNDIERLRHPLYDRVKLLKLIKVWLEMSDICPK